MDFNTFLLPNIEHFVALDVSKEGPLRDMVSELNGDPNTRLFRFTATDAKKDGRIAEYNTPIRNIWGVQNIHPDLFLNPKKDLLDTLLGQGLLYTESYTRIPGTKYGDFKQIHPDFKFFDAGSNYDMGKDNKYLSRHNGKETVSIINTASLIDSANKHTHVIRFQVTAGQLHDYEMRAFGFPYTSFQWEKNNHHFTIHYKGFVIDHTTIGQWNIGNPSVALKMQDATLSDEEKECFIVIKALGDALKSFFMIRYCLSYTKNTFLQITNDKNLFMRSLLLLYHIPNAFVMYNKNANNGTNKTVKVIMKCSPPDYEKLCKDLETSMHESMDYNRTMFRLLLRNKQFKIVTSNTLFIDDQDILETYMREIETNMRVILQIMFDKKLSFKEKYQEYNSNLPIKLLKEEEGELKIKIHTPISIRSTSYIGSDRMVKRIYRCSQIAGSLSLNSGGGASPFTEEPLRLGDDWLQIYYLVYNIYFFILTKAELKMFRSIGMAPNYDLKDAEHVKKSEIEPFIQENTLYELLAYYFEAYHDYSDEAIRKYVNELYEPKRTRPTRSRPIRSTRSRPTRSIRSRPTRSIRSTRSRHAISTI